MTCHYCKANAKKFGKYGQKRIQRYRCLVCAKTFSDEQEKPLDDMRTSTEKFLKIMALLTEGVGINAAARLTGVHKETVLRALELAGARCAKLMDERMRGLAIPDLQLDEIWGFVLVKEKHIRPIDDPQLVGDQYCFTAIASQSKLIVSFVVGKRTAETTRRFISDLSARVVSQVQLNTDSFGAYQNAIRASFKGRADHGQMVKVFAKGTSDERRYSPPEVVTAIRTPISGEPVYERISTSYIERSNLSMRTFMRRLTRLCLGYSKKLDNLRYAIALYFAYYNFCWLHSTLKTTPAVAAGLTDHRWTLEELLIGVSRQATI